MIKLSEIAVHTAQVLSDLLPRYLDQDCYHVVKGGVDEITALLKMQWDFIFFTGNGQVGRIIAKAAAEHLTPCCLELGGKSPAVIDEGTDLDVVAQRIVAGKFFNCGQTCIAPDYLLVPEELQDRLIEGLKKALKGFYGDDLRSSESYGRLINQHHWQRVKNLLDKTKGTIVIGGEVDGKDQFIAPTVITNVKAKDVLMEGEIFGPLLPILNYETLDDAMQFILNR